MMVDPEGVEPAGPRWICTVSPAARAICTLEADAGCRYQMRPWQPAKATLWVAVATGLSETKVGCVSEATPRIEIQ